MIKDDINEQIVKYSKALRLPAFRREFKQLSIDATKQQSDYETFLLRLMEKEYETRLENRKKSQIRQAGFPSKMYLYDLKRELLPENAAEKLSFLERWLFRSMGATRFGLWVPL